MTDPDAFRGVYEDALRAYLLARGEQQLRVAYELGRTAISQEIGMLELVDIHHVALASAMPRGSDAEVPMHAVVAGGDFLREALSGYEMVTRSFRDARDDTREEQRRAAMLRRLSDLLADRSLQLNGSTSHEELAHLLAEQARELCGATASLVTLKVAAADTEVYAADTEVSAAATGDDATGWRAVLDLGAARGLSDLARADAKSLRLSGTDLAAHDAFQRLAIACPLAGSLRGWIVAPLTSLHGDRLGAIQVFNAADRAFGDVDEEVAVHLAQLASAGLERRAAHPDRGG